MVNKMRLAAGLAVVCTAGMAIVPPIWAKTSPEHVGGDLDRLDRVVIALLALQQPQSANDIQGIVHGIGRIANDAAPISANSVDPAYVATPTHDDVIRSASPRDSAASSGVPMERLMPAPCPGNLVPNGDFETYTTCPSTIGEVANAPPWYLPTPGSADFFHACAGNGPGTAGVPTNFYGTQAAHSGSGVMGFRVYGNVPPNTTTDYREYIQVPLSASLVSGQTYTISFWLSLCEASSAYACKEVSAYFSAGPVYSNASTQLNLTPQFTNPGPPVTNTTGWTQVTGTFVAAGGENHMTLGNFKNDAMTTAIVAGGGCCPVTYYYIDDVCLTGPAGTLNGACCYQGAAGPVCQVLTAQQCASLNGVFGGKGTNCNGVQCNAPFGACCSPGPSGNVCQIKTPNQCAALGGTYLGNFTTCTPGDPCNPPTGACCYQIPGNPTQSCIVTTQTNCVTTYNGTYQGDNSSCFPDPCNAQGACCYSKAGFPNNFCIVTTQDACLNQYGGFYYGDNVPCPPGNCNTTPIKGACCYDIPGTTITQCVQTSAYGCLTSYNGTYFGDGTTCAMANCAEPAVGACCYFNPDGTGPFCVQTDGQTCAVIYNGLYLGLGSPCTPNPCNPPPPSGACCYEEFPSGTWFCIITTQNDCLNNYPNSTYMGDGSPCTPNPCAPQFTGACCYLQADGTLGCVVTNQPDCKNNYQGTYIGNNTTCNPNPCAPTGACCYVTTAGPVCVVTTTADCASTYSGIYQGDNTTCVPNNPCAPTGACCYQGPAGPLCTITTQFDCENNLNGTWLGASTNCQPNPCDPQGACCFQDSPTSPIKCTITTQTNCGNLPNSVWQGPNTNCQPNPCPSGACCYQIPGTPNYTCIITTPGNCVNNLHGTFYGVGTNCTNIQCRPCVHPPKKMVAWWKLDEIAGGVANDSIAGHHGGYKPTPATGPTPQPGMVDGALSFDGANDYVQVPHSPALNFNCGAFSIDAWILPQSLGGGIVNKSGVPGYDFFVANTGQLALYLTTTSLRCPILSTGTISPNVWSHVAVTASGGGPSRTITFYINGAPAGSFTTPCVCVGNVAPLLIGNSAFGGLLRGRLDEIEIFKRELGASEIAAIYNAGSVGKCKTRCHVPWDSPFCLNQNQITVSFTVCNDSPAAGMYNISFQPLNTCTIPGPTVFTPLFSNPVSIAANSCVTLQVTINRPAAMNAVYQVACYQVNVLHLMSGITSYCQGSVQDRRDLCAVIGPCCIGTDVSLPVGVSQALSFSLRNTSPIPLTIPYMLKAMDSHEMTPSEELSLNGLPPGTRYIGELTLPPDGTGEIAFTARYLDHNALAFDDIVLTTDTDGDGTFEPLISLGTQSIPILCDADIAPEPVGNGTVDIDDLVWVITHWGACPQPCTPGVPGSCEGDVNGDCAVNIDDLVKVITNWGACP